MKRILFLAISLSLFACNSSYQNNTVTYAETYIVKTIKGFLISNFNELGVIYHGEKPDTNLLIDGEFHTVSRPANIGEKDFIKKVESLNGVYYACPNRKVKAPQYVVTAPSLKTFGLDAGNLNEDKEAAYYEYALQITHARDWVDLDGQKQQGAYTKVGYGNNKVVVAIIDSGLNMNHEDFKRDGKTICLYAKSVTNLDTFCDIPIGRNDDIMGHGTHCAGTMCAVEGNNEGIAGVAYKNTYIISYKVLGFDDGTIKGIYGALGDLAEITTILKKDPANRTKTENDRIPSSVPKDFKITQKTIPVNMSLGHPSLGQYEVEMLNLAINHDVLPVVSMGNAGRVKLTYPRSLKGCLAVGATTAQDKRASFSEAGESISVSAPGAYIISTYNGRWSGNMLQTGTDRTGTQFMSGTSMAAPFVTGTIGYLLSFDEGQKLSPYQIKRLLEETADKVDEGNAPFGKYINGHSIYYGYGRVNVLEVAKSVAKVSGAKPIPEEDSFYLTKPLTIRTQNSNTKVYLYEVLPDDSLFLQGIAITNENKTVYFYGLKNETKYRVTSYVGSILREYEIITSKTGSLEYTFN